MAGRNVEASLGELSDRAATADWSVVDAASDDEIAAMAAEDGEASGTSEPEAWQLVPTVSMVRGKLGMTQEGFARLLRVPVSSLRNWEQHRSLPGPAVRTLLLVIWREPEAVKRALRAA